MINWCLNHLADMAGSVVHLVDGVREGQHGRALFDAAMFWALFQCILFADTLLFTLGYIVEVPALRNRIRSVDPTFFGWFVCLACYPPFNEFTGRFLIDDTFLASEGVTDFEKYRAMPGEPLAGTFFVPDLPPPPAGVIIDGKRWE